MALTGSLSALLLLQLLAFTNAFQPLAVHSRNHCSRSLSSSAPALRLHPSFARSSDNRGIALNLLDKRISVEPASRGAGFSVRTPFRCTLMASISCTGPRRRRCSSCFRSPITPLTNPLSLLFIAADHPKCAPDASSDWRLHVIQGAFPQTGQVIQ
jgi:hypothetical protein